MLAVYNVYNEVTTQINKIGNTSPDFVTCDLELHIVLPMYPQISDTSWYEYLLTLSPPAWLLLEINTHVNLK
jgi:hypothetical protein